MGLSAWAQAETYQKPRNKFAVTRSLVVVVGANAQTQATSSKEPLGVGFGCWGSYDYQGNRDCNE